MARAILSFGLFSVFLFRQCNSAFIQTSQPLVEEHQNGPVIQIKRSNDPGHPVIHKPQPVMIPSNYGHNTEHLNHLEPGQSGIMRYSGCGSPNPHPDSLIVELNAKFNVPTVILDHSSYISGVEWSNSKAIVTFTSSESYDHAQKFWSRYPEIILVTSVASAGPQRDYLHAQISLWDKKNRAVTCTVRELELHEAMEELRINWGGLQDGHTTSVVEMPPSHTPFLARDVKSKSSSSKTTTSSTSMKTTTHEPEATKVVCSAPKSSLIHGITAVPCGPSFDSDLDKAIGYYNFAGPTGSAALSSFMPKVTDITVEVLLDTSLMKRDTDALIRRGFFSKLASIAKAVKKVIAPIAKVVASTISKVAVAAAATVAKVVVSVVNYPVTPSISFKVPINIGPQNDDYSPWGPAKKLWQCGSLCGNKPSDSAALATLIHNNMLYPVFDNLGAKRDPVPGVTLYCIDCGVHGSVTAGGSLTLRLLDGVTSAQVRVKGGLKAGVGLGLNAFAEYKKDLAAFRIATIALPGFHVPKVVTIGPELTLDTKLSVGVSAEGQVYAGVHYDMAAFDQTIDFINQSNSKSTGWTPKLNYAFNATGTLTATAELGIPLSLAFGVDIMDGKYKLQAAAVDTSGIQAVANYTASFNAGNNNVDNTPSDCNGINWSINPFNRVEAQFTKFNWVLGSWTGPSLAKGCIAGKPIPSSSSSSPPVSTPTAPPSPDCNPCNPVILNPSFEMGTDVSWNYTVISPGSQIVTRPGTDGTKAVGVVLPLDGSVVMQQMLYTAPGTYNVTVDYWFSDGVKNCYLNAFINGAWFWSFSPRYNGASVNAWATSPALSFTASGCSTQLSVQFVCTAGERVEMRLDNLRYSAGPTCILPRLALRQASDGPLVGEYFDATSAAAETSFIPFEQPNPDHPLPPLDENMAAAIDNSPGSNVDWISLYDTSSTVALASTDSGTLTLVPYSRSAPVPGTQLAAIGSTVISDEQNRYLVYSPASIAAFNVSRLHYAPVSAIPQGSRIITLTSIPSGGRNIYAAVDTLGSAYYLAWCNVNWGAGRVPKVFLVGGYGDPLDKLSEDDVLYTITGGKVGDEGCAPLMLTSDAAPDFAGL